MRAMEAVEMMMGMSEEADQLCCSVRQETNCYDCQLNMCVSIINENQQAIFTAQVI
jgi:hypothetical protein